MKKFYSTLLFSCIGLLAYPQSPEFTIDFEGADPLTTLPAGVTSVNPSGGTALFINKNHYFVETQGGAIVQKSAGSVVTRTSQFTNAIVTESGNKLLQTDYTGHIIIDETALGTDSFTLRLNLQVFGHSQGSTDCGIFTIVGNTGTEWAADRLTSRNGGFASGLGLAVGGAAGFQYGGVNPPYREIVLTYNSTDMLYRLYIDGAIATTSSEAQASGEWNTRKIYIGFSGRNSIGVGNGNEHLNTTTGEYATDGSSNAVRNDGRNADLQMRMDNIEVYQTAITDSDVSTLFTGGTLSSESLAKETIGSYTNPVVDVLSFSSNNVSSVEVYNTLGAKVLSDKVANNNVDMSSLSQGVYLVKIQDENGLHLGTVKVVKN